MKLNKKYPRRISTSLPFCLVYHIGLGPNFCPYDRIASIMPDGSVSLCINIVLRSDGSKDPSTITDNIKHQRFKDIFLNSDFFKLIGRIRKEAAFEGVCSRCAFKRYCAPGCLAYAYRYYNKITAPNPMCQKLYEAGLFPQELIV